VQVNPEVCSFLLAFVRLRRFLDLTGVFEEGQYSSIIYGLLMLVELGTYPCNDSTSLLHDPRSADDADALQTLQIQPIGR
jgi:hypothetical protein